MFIASNNLAGCLELADTSIGSEPINCIADFGQKLVKSPGLESIIFSSDKKPNLFQKKINLLTV